MYVLALVAEMEGLAQEIQLHRNGLEKRLQWWQQENLRRGKLRITEASPKQVALHLLDLQAQWAAYACELRYTGSQTEPAEGRTRWESLL